MIPQRKIEVVSASCFRGSKRTVLTVFPGFIGIQVHIEYFKVKPWGRVKIILREHTTSEWLTELYYPTFAQASQSSIGICMLHQRSVSQL